MEKIPFEELPQSQILNFVAEQFAAKPSSSNIQVRKLRAKTQPELDNMVEAAIEFWGNKGFKLVGTW